MKGSPGRILFSSFLALFIATSCFAQKKEPKHIIEAGYTLGKHSKQLYAISYEYRFKENGVQLSIGMSEKAGKISLVTPGWGSYNFVNGFSYRMNYFTMLKYSRYGSIRIAKWSFRPGVYAGVDARYADMNIHRVNADPLCSQAGMDCEDNNHSQLISLGPHVGIKARMARVLTINISTAYPFYYPVDGKTVAYLNSYFDRSSDTPYLGGALEFSVGAGISF